MTAFPALDPIPLPAPVWLLKSLHIATWSLHIIAVQMLLGGLLVAAWLSLAARRPESRAAAAALARRLPIVMTYVINFGVPPLLFAQVLYGRALYTSSVLMGAWWIAVIPLLMACYWLLYRFSARLETGRVAWWIGAAACIVAAVVARIYAANMTLMLRPEAWQSMYAADAAGLRLPAGDPTVWPRWLFVMAGSLLVAGLWMIYLSGRKSFEEAAQRYLSAAGGRLAAVAAVLQIAAAYYVLRTQPAPLAGESFWIAELVWLAAAVLAAAVGLFAGAARVPRPSLSWGAPVIALLAAAAMAFYRDGIRDQTLLRKGFDVWAQAVVTNWSVVVLFLVVFVAGLAAVAWLISVVARARMQMEAVR
jgi:hypothetical protein